MRVTLATSPGTPGWPNEDYAAVSPGATVLLDGARPATPAATVTAVRAGPDGISYLALSDSTIAARYRDHRPPLVISDTHPAARVTPDAAHYFRAT